MKKILERLKDKIIYIDGWINVKNFIKHQRASGNIKIGIKNGLKEVPDHILAKIKEENRHTTLSPKHSPILELESKLKLKSKEEEKVKFTPAQEAKDFFNNPVKEESIKYLEDKGIPREVIILEFKKFISYWTELNKSGTKQLWELKKTFEVNRRLATWFNNVDKFSNNKQRNIIKL